MDTLIQIIPVSAIVPTYNRSEVLKKTFDIIASQNVQFQEIIIVDASGDDTTEKLVNNGFEGLVSNIIYKRAIKKGAASQRNQAVEISTQPFICFIDDDIYMQPSCLEILWNGMNSDEKIGGINAMIINQQYLPIGTFTKWVCKTLNGHALPSYAGKCIGPAYNFLPEDNNNLPELVEVDWLNTTCTLYRKSALPSPVFTNHFFGYSMMEDLTLSLTVGKNYTLLNARNARIFHDSQPGDYKSNVTDLEKMELINRHYVMTKILGKTSINDYLKLTLLEAFNFLALFRNTAQIKKVPFFIKGKLQAIWSIWKQK